MKLLKKLQYSQDLWVVVLISLFSFLLRFPSFVEPYWYGDEGIYQDIGLGMQRGALLYRDIYDNKPPLLYILYSIFNSDQFMIRIVSFLFSLVAIVCFFFIAKKLFVKRTTHYITTGIFALLLSLPLLEGNIANAENFMIALTCAAAAIILYFINGPLFHTNHTFPSKPLFIAGLLLAGTTLFKIVGIFDFAAFGIFLFFLYFSTRTLHYTWGKMQQDIIQFLKTIFPFIAGFIIPWGITILFFLFQGALGNFLQAVLSQNVGYVGYGNTLIIPQGFLILKLLILGLFILFLFIKQKIFSTAELFIFIWFAFSLFNAFFSGRPYTHYLLVLLPALMLLFGLAVSHTKHQLFAILLTIISLICIYQSFWYYKKIVPYYQNFFSYMTGTKSIEKYRLFFDSDTPNNYALAQFIKAHTNKNETVFIWGNNAQVYKLANKVPPTTYIVQYHIQSNSQTREQTCRQLEKASVKYIFVMPGIGSLPCHLNGYMFLFTLNNIQFYERSN